jgi:hypothetical protein
MQGFFIFVNLVGFVYFGFKKRYFDLYSLGFFSSMIYFLPGFFGYTQYPTKFGVLTRPTPLIDEAYLVMIVVLTSFIIAGFIYDYFIRKPPVKNIYLKGSSYAPLIMTIIGIIGFLFTLMVAGDALLASKKSVYMYEFERSRWQLVWGVGCSLGMLLSYTYKKWILFFISFSLLFFNFYIGVRSNLALTIIALFLMFVHAQGKRVLFGLNFFRKYWLQIIIFSISGYSFFFYKKIYQYVKLGMWDSILSLMSQPEFYARVITDSEPFYIQTILNEVIRQDFHVGLTYLVRNIASQLVIFSKIIATRDFNESFQPILFSYWESGLAANIWAEMWSAGGWLMLMIFIMILMILLGIGSNLLLKISNPNIKAGLALLFSYWTFYLHRNDIFNQLSYTKQIILLWVFVALVGLIFPYKKQNNINPYNNYK